LGRTRGPGRGKLGLVGPAGAGHRGRHRKLPQGNAWESSEFQFFLDNHWGSRGARGKSQWAVGTGSHLGGNPQGVGTLTRGITPPRDSGAAGEAWRIGTGNSAEGALPHPGGRNVPPVWAHRGVLGLQQWGPKPQKKEGWGPRTTTGPEEKQR